MNGAAKSSSRARGRWLARSLPPLIATFTLIGIFAADSVTPSGDEILARLESENNRRHELLKEYSGSQQYTLQNGRFGKHAAASVLMNYRQVEGQHYTVLARSGSDSLNQIIDQVLAS